MSSVATRLGAGLAGLPGVLPKLGDIIPPLSIRVRLPIPSIFGGLLRAVPKKKTSHQKKRQRQLTGRKQIKPLNNLNRCPACGNYKRQHTLCMHCVKEIQGIWKRRDAATRNDGPTYSEDNLDPVDKRILYPGKHESRDEIQLKRKHEYIYNRPRTLPVGPAKPKIPKVAPRPRAQ